MTRLASVDGVLGPVEDARLPVTDEGLLRGDGAFEVIRVYDGRPFALAAHLERLERSASNLRLEWGPVAPEVEALLAAAAPGDALLRIVLTRGGRRIALIEPLPQVPDSVTLGFVTYAPTLVLDGIKSLSYAANMQAARLARERGFDDALLVSPGGAVLECVTASFFWAAGGELQTAPLSDHVLDSITRRLVIETCDVRERSATPAQLERAQEAFVASTVREVLAVSAIEDRALEAPGPLTRAAAQRVSEAIVGRL